MTDPELTVLKGICVDHGWPIDESPCFYCAKNKEREKLIGHVPRQKWVVCDRCGNKQLTYWGSKPYTCTSCYPSVQHEQNIKRFYEELES